MTDVLTLEATWRDRPGTIGRICSLDHKVLGKRLMIATFAYFVLAGLMALTMRLHLARADSTLVPAGLYNQLFTLHGTTMMFLFAVPVMQAAAVYLVPLMLGTRSIAFPRLVNYASWVFLFGGAFLIVAFLAGEGADTGWFSYVPLSNADFSPGKGVDVWAQMITFTELSAILIAISLIATIVKLRAPGMSLARMPVFVWSTLVTQGMILFAMPAVMLGSTALIVDRLVGTSFYEPARGGDVLLWQHLFWFFGHPEVYLIFIPPLGLMSTVIPTFSGRPVVGYPLIVVSLVATGLLSFGLWVHHMFATNLPEVGKSFFTAASMMIAIPGGVQIFCWIATIATGRLRVRAPMRFMLAFFPILVTGGLSGVMLAAVSIDTQVHDSYFVVAHLHYVLIGGGVFPLLGAILYWFPKFTGRMTSERLGRWSFWTMFVGFNVAFFPMHLLGLDGMPRRIARYGADMGWQPLNALSTAGAFVLAAGLALYFFDLWRARRRGPRAPRDPWQAGGLEWAADSPPPPFNFDRLPVVRSRDPLWDTGAPGAVIGVRDDARQMLVTSAQHAEPDHLAAFPSPSIWPFLSAAATAATFVASIFTPWAVVWGCIPVVVAMIAWFWPASSGESPGG